MTDIVANLLQFSFKLNTLLFPLDIDEFLVKLGELEYRGVQKGYVSPGGLPSKQGDVAVKDNTFINIDANSQTITLSSISIKKMLDVFNEIKEPLKISGVDISKKVLTYRVASDYIADTGNNAVDKIGKFVGTNKAVKTINSITGIETQQYSISLISKEKSILDKELVEIKIEPYIKRLGKAYYIQFTMRDPDLNKIIERLSTLEDNILDIIETIET